MRWASTAQTRRPTLRIGHYTGLLAAAFLIVSMHTHGQEYSLLGSVEARSLTAYRKDSPVIFPEDGLRGTWYTGSLLRAELTHRWSLPDVEVVVDHAITAGSTALGQTDPTISAGTAGTGSRSATTVLVGHELYQGYAAIYPRPWLSIRLGRQRINWGVARYFPVSDALHPQNPDAEVEPGFDGASIALRAGSDLSLELAAAIQDAVGTGKINDVRLAAYATAWAEPVEIAVSWVWQQATMLRFGSGLSAPVGPLLLTVEGAIEMYDPRARRVQMQPLLAVGGEYTWYGERADLVFSGEYFHNGLASTYPDDPTGDLTVTTDLAGGFARPGSAYAAATVALIVTDSWSTEHSALVNVDDQSAVFRNAMTLSRVSSLDLTAATVWNIGRIASEFGLIEEGMVVELGAKMHF